MVCGTASAVVAGQSFHGSKLDLSFNFDAIDTALPSLIGSFTNILRKKEPRIGLVVVILDKSTIGLQTSLSGVLVSRFIECKLASK